MQGSAIYLCFWILNVLHHWIAMREMNRVPILAIQEATTQKTRTSAIRSIRKSKGTAADLLRIIHEFSPPLNDWDKLELVLKNTPRTLQIMEMIKKYKRCPPTDALLCVSPSKAPRIRVNEKGEIDQLSLAGLQLQDEDIADITKLPPKLKILNLSDNLFTKWDVGKMPRHLERLSLGRNRLKFVLLKNAPETLEHLGLSSNDIRYININHLKGGIYALILN